ncbi:lysophosphatidylserine lipase ABHD12-like [Ciona intestinalis]
MMLLWTLFVSFLSKLSIILQLAAAFYVAVPLAIKYVPEIVAKATFLNFVCPPLRLLKLTKPEQWGLSNVTNSSIQSSDGINLGMWHIKPKYNSHLQTASKVIIYCHGNAGHRGFGHRRYILRLFQSLGYHVIAFDYRGFGDSEGKPSQNGVVQDTLTVYKWAVKHTQSECRIFVWGHSLGTSIATHAIAEVQATMLKQPEGLILEAPFTSISEAIFRYPLSRYLLHLYPTGFIHNLICAAFKRNSIQFSTVQVLPLIKCKVLMLHAMDDTKVDYSLGEKLFNEMKACGSCKCPFIKFYSFEKHHGFGHNYIHKYPKLPALLTDFEDSKPGSEQEFLSATF